MIKLDAYVGRTVAAAILLVLLVIVGIDLLTALIDELEDVSDDYSFFQVAKYVLLTTPTSLYEYLPFAALVGCLAGLGSLAGTSELVVMRAAGISTGRLVWSVVKPALWLTFLGLCIAEFVAPRFQQIAESGRAIALQEEGKVHSEYGMWHREGDSYMHFNAVEAGGILHGVVVYQFGEGRELEKVVYAERAIFTNSEWLLEDGSVSHFSASGANKELFSQLDWDTELTPELLNILVLDPADLSISGIWQYANYLQEQGVSAAEYELAFWQKILQPLAILALVLVAISFVFGPLRQVTMGFRVFTGVMVGIVFRTMQDMLGPASLVFGFEPLVATLIPIGLCFLFGAAMMMRRV
jgi:lipopolysaccharide export system permease protein